MIPLHILSSSQKWEFAGDVSTGVLVHTRSHAFLKELKSHGVRDIVFFWLVRPRLSAQRTDPSRKESALTAILF
jgi:hypothetical protein